MVVAKSPKSINIAGNGVNKNGPVVELVDTADSKSAALSSVRVRVPLGPPE